MKILLACSAGMSTSLLEDKMKKYVEEKKLGYTILAQDSSSAKKNIDKYDVILLGPQVKFMEQEFKKLAGDKPVGIIPIQLYGMMKGPEVVQFAEELMKK